jgi:5-methylcytosine-specific restriction endonuclease McrA
MADAKPYPKSSQLARGERRYRRKVASAGTWQRIYDAKCRRCRLCGDAPAFEWQPRVIDPHHIVSREDHGDDVADNLVPLCGECHDAVTRRRPLECRELLGCLSDAEYAYMVERGGEDYPERAYGIRYQR